jgi:uncharacterized membrane protein YoaK (UPF0700 family)
MPVFRAQSPQVRDALVVVLALASGSIDAIGYVRLGGVFTSVMTGNMVLLGVSAGRHTAALAIRTGIAFVAYGLGSIVGARVAGTAETDQAVWPRQITRAIVVEASTLVIGGVIWEVTGSTPTGTVTYVLLVINAIALGTQSSAVLRFGISGLSTTYLTGTLTHVMAAIGTRGVRLPRRSVGALCGLVGGATIGAVVAVEVPRLAPAVPLVALLVVIAAATREGSDATASMAATDPTQG